MQLRARHEGAVVHGDDFTASGPDADLAWLKMKFVEKFECKVSILGPGAGQSREVCVLNRFMKWSKDGILYEPDPRHSELVVREFGLEGAKAAPAAGTRKEQRAASVPVAALRVDVEDESPELNAR